MPQSSTGQHQSLSKLAVVSFQPVTFKRGPTKEGEKQKPFSTSQTLNTGPRAGQRFDLTNIFFKFNEFEKGIITHFPGEMGETNTWEFEYTIRLFIGSLLVAEQKILESLTWRQQESLQTKEQREKEENFPTGHFVGALEPFTPPIVYAGESVTLETEFMQTPGFLQLSKIIYTEGIIRHNGGQVLLNYDLKT